MSIESRFLSDHRLIIQVISDRLTVEKMIVARENEIESGWIKEGVNTLVLVKTDTVNVSPPELQIYTEWAKIHLVPLVNSKSAVLVTSPIVTALSMLFQHSLGSIRKMQVFSTLGPAADWLDVPITAITDAAPEAKSFATD